MESMMSLGESCDLTGDRHWSSSALRKQNISFSQHYIIDDFNHNKIKELAVLDKSAIIY